MQFAHKKSLGQHFLNSDHVPRQMCAAADLVAGETVVEIGPGTGALTKEILARGARVLAIEADPRAIASLEETFQDAIAAGQLTLIHHDARHGLPANLNVKDREYIVIANIPYYLSGLLFRQFLESAMQPKTLVFLVQKEVAWRIARDKKESLLSLSVKVFGDPTYIGTVSRGHFTPPPKVDSAIIAIRNISRARLGDVVAEDFFTLLHLGFGQKRKQLLGNLSHRYQREDLCALFATLGIPETVRAEDVPLPQWLALAMHLSSTATSTA